MSLTVSTNAEAIELQSYRAISPWTPLTVLLGLASPLALVHPLLWIVPLAGILLAWIGIKQVSPLLWTNMQCIVPKIPGTLCATFGGKQEV